MNSLTNKEKIQNTIDELYETYKEDEYMNQKMVSYICAQMPNILSNMKQNHLDRVARIQEMTNEQDTFIQSFLNNNQYLYAPTTGNFFIYDGLHYQIYSEDDILHHVLSSISKDRQLMSWKYKTKLNIMKRIKENYLLNSIPESDTIQNVLRLLTSTIFSSKSDAKYFLCIIGDNLLKKTNNLIHFITPNAKHFIRHLNNLSNMLIGYSLSTTFKHKYYDHDYNNFRVLNINECIKNESIWNGILKQCVLDILCVACHYSNRYYTSEDFINNHCTNEEVKYSILSVKNTEPDILVNEFINEYIDVMNNEQIQIQITWKNMQYLWKLFLDNKKIPSVIFMNKLKNSLIDKLIDNYNQEQDIFINISSKYLPSIQRFIQYWNDTIILDENETDWEIEEILSLYKKWCSLNNEPNSNINENKILDLISYYYPSIEIEKDKYISGIKSFLWDKQLDIQIALDNLKEITREKYNENRENSPRPSTPSIHCNISIYDAYAHYCNFIKNNNQCNISSKNYFEKYIFDNYPEYILDNKFLEPEWYLL